MRLSSLSAWPWVERVLHVYLELGAGTAVRRGGAAVNKFSVNSAVHQHGPYQINMSATSLTWYGKD